MRYVTADEVRDLHRWSAQAFGGAEQVLNLGLFESAVASPQAAFGGVEAYATIYRKAAALAFSLSKNHPFADGNKRTSFWAAATFLLLNGCELVCDQDEGAAVFLDLAAGRLSREALVEWIETHCRPLPAAENA